MRNGQTLKVESWQVVGEQIYLQLPEGGEIVTGFGALAAVVPDEIVAVRSVGEQPDVADDFASLILTVARREGVDPDLVAAVVEVESAFVADAVSPKGAMGLMQLMPDTASDMGVSQPFEPTENVSGGVRYLRGLLARYDGDVTKALAAYNAGPGSVDRHGGVPPYAETRTYVKRVLEIYVASR